MANHTALAVIGGGPAGLRAAEVAATAGAQVTLYDAKPSVGRKLLVAGKGGLNLTHGEPLSRFVARYSESEHAPGIWDGLIADFEPSALREWARGLGVETFQATSGRVYPREMKAAPLLRRWIERLRTLGVRFEMNHPWRQLEAGPPYRLSFAGGESVTADAIVCALGGGSWAKTGSDGAWVSLFEKLGVQHQALVSANAGWEHDWSSEVLAVAEGQPLKNLSVSAGGVSAKGELLVTRYGLEGGAIYQLGAVLRAMPAPVLLIDFKPDFSHEQLMRKMESVRRDWLQEAKIRWKLSDAVVAILSCHEFADLSTLAQRVKNYPVRLSRPRPLDEAISSAGGVCWREIDTTLMLKKLPGVFVAGEMIDWEAPTGGYLMQGCFATGTRAGNSAAAWLRRA